MTVDKINYTHTYQIGLKQWQKIGLEGTLADGDVYQDCFNELKKEVEMFHRSSNPSLYPTGKEPIISEFIPEVEVIPADRRVQSMINDMKSVTDLKILETYEFLAKKYPEIKEAYEIKLKELEDKPIW